MTAPITPSLGPLPEPIARFEAPSPGERLHDGGLDLFALMAPRGSSEGRIVVSDGMAGGDTALYDADENLNLYLTLPRLNECKGRNPVCVSVTHPGAGKDSLYVMDRFPGRSGCHPADCFEVLEPPLRRWRHDRNEDGFSYRPWRLLPPPPVLHEPGSGCRPCRIISYATVVGADGCTSILVSFDRSYGPDGTVGTYRFDTARHADVWMHVEEWRRVRNWALPFDGGAQHVPELGLWLGFSARNPHRLSACRLCAVDDLSMAAAVDEDDHGRPAPTVRHVWGEGDEDLHPPGAVESDAPHGGEPGLRQVLRRLVLRSRQARQFRRGHRRGDSSRQRRRRRGWRGEHKSARYDCTNDYIQWVL